MFCNNYNNSSKAVINRPTVSCHEGNCHCFGATQIPCARSVHLGKVLKTFSTCIGAFRCRRYAATLHIHVSGTAQFLCVVCAHCPQYPFSLLSFRVLVEGAPKITKSCQAIPLNVYVSEHSHHWGVHRNTTNLLGLKDCVAPIGTQLRTSRSHQFKLARESCCKGWRCCTGLETVLSGLTHLQVGNQQINRITFGLLMPAG